MTKLPETLATHLGREATTLCHCWRLMRRDGTVLGFTDHDRALQCDGTQFSPRSGLSGSEAKESADMAVDTVDVEGVLSSLDIEEEDILSGAYDGARVDTLLVDWTDTQCFAVLRQAAIGRIERRDGRFVAELESLTASLDRPNGRTIGRKCDAELGDGRCGFDTDLPGFSGTGVVVRVEGNDTIVVQGLEGFEDGWFSNGVLSWAPGSGKNGIERIERIVHHRTNGSRLRLVLWTESMASIAAGDAFSVIAGCDKQFATCREKFANGVNFRGFPHLPGNDRAYGYVSEDGVFDGGVLVE